MYVPKFKVASAVPNYLSMQSLGVQSWMMELEWEECPGYAGEQTQDETAALKEPADAFSDVSTTLTVNMDDPNLVQTVITGKIGLVADAPPRAVAMRQFRWRDPRACGEADVKETLIEYITGVCLDAGRRYKSAD